eukprot:2407590-Prymnesium_polylepis.1
MWTGRAKIDAQGNVIKDNARCVARGDLHSKHYNVTANQSMSPVVARALPVAQRHRRRLRPAPSAHVP